MRIVISDNMKEVAKNLDYKYQRQIPFAASRALNDVAMFARKESNRQTDKKFEGGATGYTKRAFFYRRSNKMNLLAEVFLRDSHSYLEKQIEGGTELPKRQTILTSTYKSKLNKYGNFTRGRMQQMINDKSKYFNGAPKGHPEWGEGIWERYGRKTKAGGQKIRKVGAYIDEARYKKRFPFYRIVSGVVESRSVGFSARFRERLDEATKTAR